jgi:hypothetical protein
MRSEIFAAVKIHLGGIMACDAMQYCWYTRRHNPEDHDKMEETWSLETSVSYHITIRRHDADKLLIRWTEEVYGGQEEN